MNFCIMPNIAIFTGLTRIGSPQLGEAQDYTEIAQLLTRHGHRVTLITPNACENLNIRCVVYTQSAIEQEIIQSDIVFAGAYAPAHALMLAWKMKKKIILNLY